MQNAYTSNSQNAVPATVFEDIIVESTQETPSKLDFHPAFAPAMTRPRVCCKHFTTNKNSKFLGFLTLRTTYVASSCAQKNPHHGFYEAK